VEEEEQVLPLLQQLPQKAAGVVEEELVLEEFLQLLILVLQ